MMIIKNILTFILLFWFAIQALGFTKSQMKVNRLDKEYNFNRPNIFMFDIDVKEYLRQERLKKKKIFYIDRRINKNNESKQEIKPKDVVGVMPKQLTFKKKVATSTIPDIEPVTDTIRLTPQTHKILIKRVDQPK